MKKLKRKDKRKKLKGLGGYRIPTAKATRVHRDKSKYTRKVKHNHAG